jgi:formylglycine-generating enzyme required for sulfatase activity
MRFPTYQEWLAAAIGNPQGEDAADNYGWTKTTNTGRARTGCQVNPSTGVFDASGGIKPFAISAYNCVDMIGNVWEWLADYSARYDAEAGTWGFKDQLGAGMGQIYAWKDDGFAALIAGGGWNNGVRCGPRSVSLHNYPWDRSTAIGSRLACDAA